MSPEPKLPAASRCQHSWLGFVLLHLHWSLLLIRHQSAGFIHTMLDMTASAAINTFRCSSHVQSLIHGMPLITTWATGNAVMSSFFQVSQGSCRLPWLGSVRAFVGCVSGKLSWSSTLGASPAVPWMAWRLPERMAPTSAWGWINWAA